MGLLTAFFKIRRWVKHPRWSLREAYPAGPPPFLPRVLLEIWNAQRAQQEGEWEERQQKEKEERELYEKRPSGGGVRLVPRDEKEEEDDGQEENTGEEGRRDCQDDTPNWERLW
ncbi:hypothetical protein EDC01DRAFT_782580 [Geopyxis carbonaria]|nr:hypothetical protein EDC01DRAFT_782580 [Geopyxis carbonaria]